MGQILSLDEARARTHSDGPARCACGSEWFLLRGRPTDPEVAAAGAVTLSAEGRVTGYAGAPVCADCGEPWAPRAGWRMG